MVYRFMCDLSFPDLETAQQCAQAMAPFQDEAITINQGEINAEPSWTRLMRSTHDQPQPSPCTLLSDWASAHPDTTPEPL